MLTKKQAGILKLLIEARGYMTAEALGNRLQISERTIKRYMADLEGICSENHVTILSAKGMGYYIDGTGMDIKQVYRKATILYAEELEWDGPEDRIQKILQQFLLEDYLTNFDLADRLNLSPSTIHKLMKPLKDYLKRYSVKLESKPHYGSKLSGSEEQIRQLLLKHGFKTLAYGQYDYLPQNIQKEEMIWIRDDLAQRLSQMDLMISDEDFENLLKAITVSLDRLKQGKEVKVQRVSQAKASYEVVLKNLLVGVNQKFDCGFSEQELAFIQEYAGFMPYNYNNQQVLSSHCHKHSEWLQFVFSVLEEINTMTGNQFGEDFQFVKAITIHLELLQHRLNLGEKSHNPLLYQMKRRYPVEMNLATFMAKRVEEAYHFELKEEEIAFLAMHFGASLERQKRSSEFKIAVFCHYGMGTAQLLAEKIKRNISNVEVVGVYPLYQIQEISRIGLDCMVVTQPIAHGIENIPLLVIDDILSDQSIQKIDDYIRMTLKQQEVLFQMFHPKAFARLKAKNAEEAIGKLGECLIERELIDKAILASILEREKIASTDIGNLVAIPHTTLNGDHQSIIGVGILEHPICWHENMVQVVMMICFNLSDVAHVESFQYMLDIIQDVSLIEQIIQSKTMEEVKQLLSKGKWTWNK